MRVCTQVIIIVVSIGIRILISKEAVNKLKRNLHENRRKLLSYFMTISFYMMKIKLKALSMSNYFILFCIILLRSKCTKELSSVVRYTCHRFCHCVGTFNIIFWIILWFFLKVAVVHFFFKNYTTQKYKIFWRFLFLFF